MELAGKYGVNPGATYVPDAFPDQALMQGIAMQTSSPELRKAALQFQYPFKLSELINSKYSNETKNQLLRILSLK